MATGGGGWDCPFCTYINKQSSFKCDMCKASRGTSTRQARMQPHVLVMHQSTETPKNAKGSGPSLASPSSSLSTPPSTFGQSTSSTEKDRMSSASSSRSSSPMSQWFQNNSQPLKVQLIKTPSSSKASYKKGKSRGRAAKGSNWPRVPNLDYKNGISLDVECRKVTATITEYTTLQQT